MVLEGGGRGKNIKITNLMPMQIEQSVRGFCSSQVTRLSVITTDFLQTWYEASVWAKGITPSPLQLPPRPQPSHPPPTPPELPLPHVRRKNGVEEKNLVMFWQMFLRERRKASCLQLRMCVGAAAHLVCARFACLPPHPHPPPPPPRPQHSEDKWWPLPRGLHRAGSLARSLAY